MNRGLAFLLALALALGACGAPAAADGVTLRTVSVFAGSDAAADIYVDLLKTWQEETGNTVVDSSATSDEEWKNGVLKDFAAGNEADVLFFFARTAESASILNKVVPIAQINAAYPGLELPMNEAVAEADGQVYTIPVRPFWEGLFVNTDLFEQYGLELPTTWERMQTAIRVFRQNGVVPISVSLSDVPHYLVEFCILSCGSVEDFTARPRKGESVPQSWVDGMRLIRELYEMGAFPDDVNATTEAAASQLFRDKKAAMQIDGSWFANSLSQQAMRSTIVMPFPAVSGEADPTAYLYGISMGFYLTRAAWNDTARRDAAVQLLAYLSTGQNARALSVFALSGSLMSSFQELVAPRNTSCLPIQDAMQPDARVKWFSYIPGVATGAVDPQLMWDEIMEMDPFAK